MQNEKTYFAPGGFYFGPGNRLRSEDTFLVLDKKENGAIDEATISAEQGGELRLKLLFKTWW